MKERESELTIRVNSPKLEVERYNFMADPGAPESNPEQPSFEKNEAARSAWDALNKGRNISFDERSTQQMLIDRGIMPMVGGADDYDVLPQNPAERQTPTTPQESVDYLEQIKRETEARRASMSNDAREVLANMVRDTRGDIPIEILEEAARRVAEAGTIEGIRQRAKPDNDEIRRMLLGEKNQEQNVKKEIEDLVKQIDSSQTMDSASGDIDKFLEYAQEVKDAKNILGEREKEEFRRKIDEIRSDKSSGNLSSAKDKVNNFQSEVEKYFMGGEGLEVKDVPESLEDLAALIMRSSGEEWKTGGERELVTKEGKIVRENFIAWVRQRMVDLHEFKIYSTVDFFSEINVRYRFGNISFYEMIFTGSYFLEKRNEKILKQKGDGTFYEDDITTFHENKDYEDMKQQLITETFLFGNSRNNHVTYTAQMFDEKELPKLIAQMYYANPFTRGRFFEQILTMPTMNKDKIDDIKAQLEDKDKFEESKIKTIIEKNGEVGEGVRKALLAYYYINDFKMLEKILGKDSVFFKEEYVDYDSEKGKPNLNKDGSIKVKKGEANQEFILRKDKNGIEYKNGKLDTQSMGKFIKYVNVFNDATKDERVIKEVRERIVQTMVNDLRLSYSEAKYAENWAFSMTRWTGIGARNDVAAIGYDAWSKAQNLLEYRIKQTAEKRKGVVGNLYNLLGIKRAGLTFFDGVTDVHNRSIIEAIQGGQGDDYSKINPFLRNNEEEREKLEHLEFKQDTALRFATNHVANSFKIYDFIINHTEFDIANMVTNDSTGRLVIDQKKANEMIDGIQKAIRYAYCTWAGIDYSKNIRVWEGGEAKEMPTAAALFGPDILRFIKEDMERKGGDLIENQNKNIWEVGDEKHSFEMDFAKIESKSEEGDKLERDILWKHIFKYLMAEEIKSHRSFFSELSRFNYGTVEKIYNFLKIKGTITDEDIQDMRKISRTSERRMFGEDFELALGAGGTVGIWKALRIMFKDVAGGK